MISMILLSISELISLYKDVAELFIGASFVISGIAVVKYINFHPERKSEYIIKYLVALAIFLVIWSLI